MADQHAHPTTEPGTATADGSSAQGNDYATGRYGVDQRKSVSWSAAIWAGLISGAVFLMLEMIMVPLFLGMSAWAPPRMIAAIVMGQGVLPPPDTFDIGIVVVAMIVHFVLSVIYAVVLAFIINRWGMGKALAAGAVFGLVLYLVNFYGMTAVFPWFAMARNWVSVFAHMVFGVVAAWAYHAIVHRNK